MIEASINKYVVLCSKLCSCPSDYTAKNVRKHNNAHKQIILDSKELCENTLFAEAVFSSLLKNESPVVRTSAAAQCLKHNICTENAVKTLENIQNGDNSLLAFEAEMVLKVWRDGIVGKKL